MNPIATMFRRKSCRTFNGLRPDSATMEQLHNLCNCPESIASEAGIASLCRNCAKPVIKIINADDADGKLGTYGFIRGARTFFAMGTGDSVRDHVLAAFLLERIVLRCTEMNLGTCWVGGTFGHSNFQRAFDETGTETGYKVRIICPVGHPTEKTRFAERLMRRISSADTRKPFSELFSGIEEPSSELISNITNGSATTAVSGEQAVAIALECVRRAPSSTNSQPWRATVQRDASGNITAVEFSTAKQGKLTAYDMGIAYCHFSSACTFLGLKGEWVPKNDSLTEVTFRLPQT